MMVKLQSHGLWSMNQKDKQELQEISLCMFPTGSRIICNPPVLDTDEDWYILVSNLDEFEKAAFDLGFEETTKKDGYGFKSDFITFRRDEINLIVTEDLEFFQCGALATSACILKNTLDKKDRIYIFEWMRTHSYNIPYAVRNWESYYDRKKAAEIRRKNVSSGAYQQQLNQAMNIASNWNNNLAMWQPLGGTITGRLT